MRTNRISATATFSQLLFGSQVTMYLFKLYSINLSIMRVAYRRVVAKGTPSSLEILHATARPAGIQKLTSLLPVVAFFLQPL